MDIKTNIENEIVLKPMEGTMVKTGLFLEIPVGYETQIRPGSGLEIKNGITILNSPGTIDADYRGEVCKILLNLFIENFVIKDEERICQRVISKPENAEWIDIGSILETDRGAGRIENTGKS